MAEFLNQTERIISLLDAEGEEFWRTRIADAALKVRNSNWQGFSDFLSGYGTSGSFHECSICVGEWKGGSHLWQPAEKLKYQEFEDLKGSAYTLARNLARLTAPSISDSLVEGYELHPFEQKVFCGLCCCCWPVHLLLVGLETGKKWPNADAQETSTYMGRVNE